MVKIETRLTRIEKAVNGLAAPSDPRWQSPVAWLLPLPPHLQARVKPLPPPTVTASPGWHERREQILLPPRLATAMERE